MTAAASVPTLGFYQTNPDWFAQGTDGYLYNSISDTTGQPRSWSRSPIKIGGPPTSFPPNAGTTFARGTNGNAGYVTVQRGLVTEVISSRKPAAPQAPGRGGGNGNGGPHKTVWESDWGSWHDLGLAVPTDAAVLPVDTGWARGVRVLARTASNQLQIHDPIPNLSSPSGSWNVLAVNCAADPAVAMHPDGRWEIFYVGIDGAMWHTFQRVPGGV